MSRVPKIIESLIIDRVKARFRQSASEFVYYKSKWF